MMKHSAPILGGENSFGTDKKKNKGCKHKSRMTYGKLQCRGKTEKQRRERDAAAEAIAMIIPEASAMIIESYWYRQKSQPITDVYLTVTWT